ncbi:MAG: hypothetical protein QNK37_17340 [Acidobacteriota bacterium]|nr:hypothetical protein [Acidobacteriota bacterium]
MSQRKLPAFLNPAGDDFIWLLGFGYFLCYIPYGGLTKAVTRGLLPGVDPVSGPFILPLSAMATLLGMFAFVSIMGWWRYTRRKTVAGFNLPVPRKSALVSGIATAVIIGTTTMAFSFDGVSIVFSLILMRGGVLLIGRITDAISQRKVHWYSALGMFLTLAALFVIFAEDGGTAMTTAAAINLGLYLTGYTVRFQVIRKLTKTRDQEARMRYFTEEQMVAMPALVLGLGLMALIGADNLMLALRSGFTDIWTSTALLPAVLIGFGYASLYLFGTMIYLDRREYTFCVPVNRAASILSGVVATLALHLLVGYSLPSPWQLTGAALLITAILVLSLPGHLVKTGQAQAARLFLFVCNGNRMRSPLAQALCTAEMAASLGLDPQALARNGIQVASAGLTAKPGSPLKDAGKTVLTDLGVALPNHASRLVDREMLLASDQVFCMTADQRDKLVELAPEASARIHCLDPDGDIDEPTDVATGMSFALKARELLKIHLARLGMVN